MAASSTGVLPFVALCRGLSGDAHGARIAYASILFVAVVSMPVSSFSTRKGAKPVG